MPDMDELAVLQIREMAPHAPVIMLTGVGTEARELGVTDFLAKGFSLHELGATLNQVLKQPDQVTGKPLSFQQFSAGVDRESSSCSP